MVIGSSFLPFPEARALARTLNITSPKHWRDYRASHLGIKKQLPASIHNAYQGKGFYSDFFNYLGREKRVDIPVVRRA